MPEARIYAQSPRSKTPQETPKTRRERRRQREQQFRATLRTRRLLVGLPLLILLLIGLLILPGLLGEDAVARLEVPTLEVGPKAPTAKDPSSGSKSGSQLNRGAEATGTSVETQLTGKNKDSLRNELQRIAKAYPATYGVVVFDPSTGESVAMGADQRFVAASLGKLPLLMALYRAAASGEVNLEDQISMQASDVQAYGTGVLYTYPIGYTMTLRECANFLIKKSDNTAWKMLDLMANTDFEDRLPRLLPEGTRVSHKIGYYGSTFADAGVVFPKGSRDAQDAYFIVVMASETGDSTSRAATQQMSLATYRILSEPAKPKAGHAPGN